MAEVSYREGMRPPRDDQDARLRGQIAEDSGGMPGLHLDGDRDVGEAGLEVCARVDSPWQSGARNHALPPSTVPSRKSCLDAGHLLAASQWHHGTSTYGAYFVDRPPLLMAVFALADLLGGGLALRMIGLLAAALAVAIAGRIGGRYAAAAAALLVITPSFGTTNVDGELLALPLVLGGLYALLVAFAPTTERPSRVAAAAGVLAMAAFLVKQDMVDVFVAAASVGVVFAAGRQWRQARAVLAGFAGGAPRGPGGPLVRCRPPQPPRA